MVIEECQIEFVLPGRPSQTAILVLLLLVYGDPYVKSGRRVMELFKAKGWMAIATDNLAGYVLGCTTIAVGIVTGGSALVVERVIHDMHPEAEYASFVFGPLPGYAGTAFT